MEFCYVTVTSMNLGGARNSGGVEKGKSKWGFNQKHTWWLDISAKTADDGTDES